jgi:hypothetical protein
MAKFRKKPVVIEAFKVGSADAPPWALDALNAASMSYSAINGKLTIRTLEGDMRADPGDWIIRGVKGELYPCKPDIFAATYEPVED